MFVSVLYAFAWFWSVMLSLCRIDRDILADRCSDSGQNIKIANTTAPLTHNLRETGYHHAQVRIQTPRIEKPNAFKVAQPMSYQ